MEGIVKIIMELGSFGLLLALSGFIIYSYVKNGLTTVPTKKQNNGQESLSKSDIKEIIDDSTKEIKSEIKEQSKRIDDVEEKVLQQVKKINDRVDNIETMSEIKSSHTKQFIDRLKLGPQLHKTLNAFRKRINADHIFIGSFHNGNESITGIPYYKFDIIAERFSPEKVERDIEFAPLFKDVELLRHDSLPTEIIQRGVVKYIINEDGSSNLRDIDDIIYHRMIGRDIKQLAIALLRDPSGTPSGFVGCVRYDYEELDIEELKTCGDELEQIYSANDKLINNNGQI